MVSIKCRKNDLKHQLPEERRKNIELEELDENMKYFEESHSIGKIGGAIEELFDKIWFDRHVSVRYRIETSTETVILDMWNGHYKPYNG